MTREATAMPFSEVIPFSFHSLRHLLHHSVPYIVSVFPRDVFVLHVPPESRSRSNARSVNDCQFVVFWVLRRILASGDSGTMTALARVDAVSLFLPPPIFGYIGFLRPESYNLV